ncbi:DNA-binding transcriptional ArsR family regulator [Arcticibacter tournemirensis]|jgi:DNA-binding transcriptional ArsR family regulator|uniref:Helix-turn-helix transcriptional regulator n=1 Tax=Arcticibacter tournemirensis TaxID=699437 RepID=A0A5M9GSG6_9SPHI|nr:metalloregulator ArsR/SmtB family transcription factor [Arcticibacter tournemirensis]KAA8477506.1 helix-turn-helix transcriptional regulator [Arcticibacter tournemirensis]TQM51336.1 DNA-binding transcriptional ArsR family regulator [Arcticibacter tournemirensis]
MENQNTCIRVLADANQIKECKELLSTNQIVFTGLSNILALAGNEARLKILFLLEEEGELCPCDLADILSMSIPAISQHLRKMKDGRIIKARKVAQTIFYSIEPKHLKLLKPLFSHITESSKKAEQI